MVLAKFFTSEDIINADIVNYSGLVNMNFYTSDITHTKSSDGYFGISYDKNNSPNSSSSISYENQLFYVKNVYFTNLIHNNIQGITDPISNANQIDKIQGEFIIEAFDDKSKYLCLCFLLKSTISNTGSTDDSTTGLFTNFFNTIITTNGSINTKNSSKASYTATISDNRSIPQQTDGCISYKVARKEKDNDTNINTTIIVFLNPITYNNSHPVFKNLSPNSYLDGLKKFKMYASYPLNKADKNNTKQNLANGVESTNKSGMALENDIYIDCNPTGEGEENIKTYKLPINSDLMGDIQNSSLSKLINNFAMFGVLLLVSYVGIPKLYNMAVCDKMNDEDQYYARIFILFYFIIVIFALFVDGSADGDMTELLVGFFFIFLAILTYVLVLDVGSNNDQDFNISTFIIFFVEVLSYVLFKPKNLAIIILFFVILMITVCLVKDNDGNTFITTKTGKKTTAWLSLLVIPTFAGLITWIIE